MKVDNNDSVQADALLSTKDILKDRLLGQGRWEHMGAPDLCSAFRFLIINHSHSIMDSFSFNYS